MTDQQIFKISDEEAGGRADHFITQKYPDFARSSLVKLFDHDITINGEHVKNGYKLRVGDTIRVDMSLLTSDPPKIKIPIVYEDDNVLVLNKPSGLLTHSKGGLNNEATVASFLKSYLDSSFELDNNRAGIVHRLDRGTSGVIICAKNSSTASYLQKQFSQRKVKKLYEALIDGSIDPSEAIIDAALERNPSRPQTFRTSSHGKSAQTHYKVGKVSGNMTLLQLSPTTGRTHQLRVHLSYMGHPIIGDNLYGGRSAPRLMLHASELEITIPSGNRKIFSAPLAKEIIDFVDADNGR